jgi:hypothetical protein
MAKGKDDTQTEAERCDAFERGCDYSHEVGGTEEPDQSNHEDHLQAGDLARMPLYSVGGRGVEPIPADYLRPDRAMPAATAFEDLLHPAVVCSRAEALARPSPVSRSVGIAD